MTIDPRCPPRIRRHLPPAGETRSGLSALPGGGPDQVTAAVNLCTSTAARYMSCADLPNR